MSDLRIGVAGATGGMGRLRVQAFNEHPRAVVAAVWARSADAVGQLAQETGAAVAPTDLDLVASPDIDAVCLSTPNTQHERLLRAALDAGKHVCVEYPLVQTLEAAEELRDLAGAKGLVLSHAMTVRLEARHLALQSALPRIGRPVSAHYRYFGGGRWYLDPALRGNRWLAFEIHFLDQAEHLFGSTKWLSATSWDVEGYSFGSILGGYDHCPAVTMEFGMGFSRKPGYAITIVGDRGWLGFEGGKVFGEDDSGTFDVPLPDSRPIALDSDSFVHQVLHGAGAVCPWEQGRRAMQLALLADESACGGRRPDVPPPTL